MESAKKLKNENETMKKNTKFIERFKYFLQEIEKNFNE